MPVVDLLTSLFFLKSVLTRINHTLAILPLAVSVRAVHRLLEQRHHGVAWPSTEHPITHLASAIIRRINEASGLYQMFSVLADVVLLKE